MPYFEFIWTEEVIAHLAEHDVSPEDFARVVMDPDQEAKSRSTGNPAAWGYTEDGRYIIAVYKRIDFMTVLPVTAYEVCDPNR
jgi:hypothetical protein